MYSRRRRQWKKEKEYRKYRTYRKEKLRLKRQRSAEEKEVGVRQENEKICEGKEEEMKRKVGKKR